MVTGQLSRVYLDNEKELLTRVAGGDHHAYKVIFDRFWQPMYANALHFTKHPNLAQDLAQEIFLKIWLMREKLVKVERFESFLFAVAKNMILDELRRLQSSPAFEEFFDAYFDLSEEKPTRHYELKDLEKNLHEAINQLPQQMQTAFKLSRFEGLSHEQIAQRMNISRVTSQNYIARAIVAIRKYMSDKYIELAVLLSFLLLH